MSKPPTFIECSACGREFGSKSIVIHEPKCLQKLRQTVIRDSGTDQTHKGQQKKRKKKTSPNGEDHKNSSIGTSNKKISLPKIPNNYLIYPRNSAERPTTATLDRPRILNPDYKHYDMSLTRIDFGSSPTLPGMDDNHNNSRSPSIDTTNRSPFILPAMNTSPGITSRVSQHNKAYRTTDAYGGPAKLSAGGIVHATNVTDALLGQPYKPNSTLHSLGHDLAHEPFLSRQSGNQVSPSQDIPDSGDVPSFPPDFFLHATPIEIKRDSVELEQNPELVHRTLHQPHQDVFVTPSTPQKPIGADAAERKDTVEIVKENGNQVQENLLDEADSNTTSKTEGLSSSSEDVQKKSKDAELTNSVSVIYFKLTRSPREAPSASASETSLVSDHEASGDTAQDTSDQLIRIVDDNSSRIPWREGGNTSFASDNENQSNPIAQNEGNIVTNMFHNLVGIFCKKSEKSKILASKEQVLGNEAPEFDVFDTRANDSFQQSSQQMDINQLSSSELNKPKSGNKSITFSIDSNIYHDPPPNFSETPLELIDETFQTKSNLETENSQTNLMEFETCSESEDEEGSSTAPIVPLNTSPFSSQERTESNCIDVKSVVSSCTLLRRKSKSMSFSKKTIEDVEDCSQSELNATMENGEKMDELIQIEEHIEPKPQEIEPARMKEEIGISDSMESILDAYNERMKVIVKNGKVQSLNIETFRDSNSELSPTLKNQSPSEFLGEPCKFLQNANKNCDNRVRGRKSINTKKTIHDYKDLLGDDVTIWEGLRLESDNEPEFGTSSFVETQPQVPPPPLPPPPPTAKNNRNQSSSTRFVPKVPRDPTFTDKILSQMSISKNTVEIDNKKKKNKAPEKTDLLGQLVGSLVRLHDLHSQKQNEHDVQYSSALTTALIKANQYAKRPVTPANLLKPPYENDPPTVFSPWPRERKEVKRPQTARARQVPSEVSNRIMDSKVPTYDWRPQSEVFTTPVGSNDTVSTQLPPFYINPADNLHPVLVPSTTTKKRKKAPAPPKKQPVFQPTPAPGFRPSTAERLSTPRWLNQLYYYNDTKVMCCNSRPTSASSWASAKSMTKQQVKQPRSCKSAMGTQTPHHQERLLTPTQIRKQRVVGNSAAGSPYFMKPNSPGNKQVTSHKRLPLVPKPKVESVETQTKSKKFKAKKEKEKLFTPIIIPRPVVVKEVAICTTDSDTDSLVEKWPTTNDMKNEAVVAQAETSLQSSTGTRRVSAQVRFMDKVYANDPRLVKSAEENQSVNLFNVEAEMLDQPPELSQEDYKHFTQFDGPSEKCLLTTAQSQDEIKLKKVKVTSSKEADQIELSYKRKSSLHNMSEEMLSSTCPSEKVEATMKGFITFPNIAMIVPTTPSTDKDFIDLNIVVRRRKLDGTFSKLEDIVSEISSNNFYLIIDEVEAEAKQHQEEAHDINDNVTSQVKQLVPFLISVSSPIESYLTGYELRNFGKIAVKNLKQMVNNCEIPAYKAVPVNQTLSQASDFDFEKMKLRSREASLSRSSTSLKRIRSLKSVDVETWGLACVTSKESQDPTEEEGLLDTENEAELTKVEANRIEKIMGQLL